ncbi:hypothetical protein [Bradyrhizobium sp. BR 1433]|uniref:hypothetical protein n=1 Tax=Bradyrhizobium sp. BR 1433 TaxID=3447967 RepID=UPI003EE5C0D4
MSIDQDDRKAITPPEKSHPDDKVRSIVEAVASEVPLGGMVVKLVGDLVLTQARKPVLNGRGNLD